jgi:hypothetical protein
MKQLFSLAAGALLAVGVQAQTTLFPQFMAVDYVRVYQ